MRAIAAMLAATRADNTSSRYGAVARTYTEAGVTLSADDVQAYLQAMADEGKASATLNLTLSALKALARAAVGTGELAETEAARIAMVKGWPNEGKRLGMWFSADQAQALRDLPDRETLAGIRDRAVLAMLLGGGFRRSELVALTVEQLAIREGRTLVLDLVGKRRRVRSVPLPAWAAQSVAEWREAAGIRSGTLFRPVRGKKVYDRALTADWVHWLVTGYVKKLGGGLKGAPHDMRRTFGKLAVKGGAQLRQVQLAYGHQSLEVTQRYLSDELDLENAACDHLGLE